MRGGIRLWYAVCMIKIIDYKAGNAPSVMHAVRHLGFPAAFVCGSEDMVGASHIILPGVGSAKATLASLSELDLLRPLEEAVMERRVPFLGICVGMQILFSHSEEDDTPCLGWLPGSVRRFDSNTVRVPQMGWNRTRFLRETPVCPRRKDYFYFVNSYYAQPADETDLWAAADYGGDFAAAVQRGNIYATQFHIEKSGEAGLALLRGFLTYAD